MAWVTLAGFSRVRLSSRIYGFITHAGRDTAAGWSRSPMIAGIHSKDQGPSAAQYTFACSARAVGVWGYTGGTLGYTGRGLHLQPCLEAVELLLQRCSHGSLPAARPPSSYLAGPRLSSLTPSERPHTHEPSCRLALRGLGLRLLVCRSR